jgi:outer membrane protein, multidrug efflux system
MYPRIATVAMVCAVAGCSLVPTYERPTEPIGGDWPTGAAYRSRPAPRADTLAAAEIGWRDIFTDPALRRVIALALQNNRDLVIAAKQVAQVEAQYRLQRSALLPQVVAGLSTQGTRGLTISSANGSTSVVHQASASLAVSWEADFFGRLHSLDDAARQQLVASTHARQAVTISLIAQVAEQYLAVVAADEQLVVTRDTLATAKASYGLAEVQFNAGVGTELDLRLAQTIVDQAEANLAAQTRARAQAQNGLVLLVGGPLPADLQWPSALDDRSVLADIPAGLPSDLLDRRPDVLEAEATLRAENADIGAARAAFFPQISLTGSLGSASATLGGLLGPGSLAWSFVPSLVAPIFNAGANRANLDIAKLQKDIGIAQYQKATQTAFREVADGLAAQGTFDAQLAALRRDEQAQQRRLELAKMRYQNGVDSYLGVLTAQTDYYNVQALVVAAKMDRLDNLAALYRSLGGGWGDHTNNAR